MGATALTIFHLVWCLNLDPCNKISFLPKDTEEQQPTRKMRKEKGVRSRKKRKYQSKISHEFLYKCSFMH